MCFQLSCRNLSLFPHQLLGSLSRDSRQRAHSSRIEDPSEDHVVEKVNPMVSRHIYFIFKFDMICIGS